MVYTICYKLIIRSTIRYPPVMFIFKADFLDMDDSHDIDRWYRWKDLLVIFRYILIFLQCKRFSLDKMGFEINK